MEAIIYGLKMTLVPFLTIYLIITIWWTFVDMSASKITKPKRTLWMLLVVLLPPFGSLLYKSLGKKEEATPAP